MAYSARVLADSISPDSVRLTTLEVTLPRIVLAEFNTHRDKSRNSASSRAIPVQKMLQRVQNDPFVPESWGKNQSGMQAGEDLSEEISGLATREWLEARDDMVKHVENLLNLGVHKQITNRLLEPFLWHTIVCTATEWSNFWHLRKHKDAQPQIRIAAEMMWEAMEASTPAPLKYGEWHLPLIYAEDWEIALAEYPEKEDALKCLIRVSVGRCARVSYLTHDGKRDHSKDVELYHRLLEGGHLSPFEHVARPLDVHEDGHLPLLLDARVDPKNAMSPNVWAGNLRGWVPVRKMIPHEEDILGHRGS